MQCDVCKEKEATVFLTHIVEGKMQKVNLCETCSKEKGVNDPAGFELTDLLLGLGSAQDIERNAGALKCPVCGFTQADFKKTARLGCSACYDTFADALTGMLKGMHKGIEHIGKAPKGIRASVQRNSRLKALHQNLEKAVAAEEYEKAAGLRDEIRGIESDVQA